jgi:hypothetical protein
MKFLIVICVYITYKFINKYIGFIGCVTIILPMYRGVRSEKFGNHCHIGTVDHPNGRRSFRSHAVCISSSSY